MSGATSRAVSTDLVARVRYAIWLDLMRDGSGIGSEKAQNLYLSHALPPGPNLPRSARIPATSG
jgi:hypothetical protein